MQIFLRHNKTYTLDVGERDSIEDLMSAASLKLGIPSERFQLTFKGKTLELLGRKFPSDYEIRPSSAVFVILRPFKAVVVRDMDQFLIDVPLHVVDSPLLPDRVLRVDNGAVNKNHHAQLILKCPQGHAMVTFGTQRYDGKGWACNGCETNFNHGSSFVMARERYRCLMCHECNYDLCGSCVERRQDSGTVMIKAHSDMTMDELKRHAVDALGLQTFLAHDALCFKVKNGSNLPTSAFVDSICGYIEDDQGKMSRNCSGICVSLNQNNEFVKSIDLQVTNTMGRETAKRLAAESAALEAEREAKKAKTSNDSLIVRLLSALPHSNRYTQYRVTALGNTDPTYVFLGQKIQSSLAGHRAGIKDKSRMPAPLLEVDAIEEVFTPRLIEKYTLELQHITGLSRSGASEDISMEHGVRLLPAKRTELNEFLLFHGAKLEDIDDICTAGFDPRRAGESAGSLFGYGTYFAENCSKADLYAGPVPFRKFQRRMCVLVARVAMGQSLGTRVAMKGIKLPPKRLDSRYPYDSVWAINRSEGGCVDYREYIVYKDAQAYPAFRVWYRHKDSCKCARCCT